MITVSILVLMELPREPDKKALDAMDDWSFNPCFNGIAS